MTELPSFILVSLMVIVAPGPDTALTLQNSFAWGRMAGLFTALGIAVGQLVWATVTSLGLAPILDGSPRLLAGLKLLGGAYLIAIGALAIVAIFRDAPALAVRRVALVRSGGQLAAALRRGLISNLTNPKMLPFFVSLIPSYAAASPTPVRTALALGGLFAFLTLAWLGACALLAGAMASTLLRRQFRDVVAGAMGVALIILGALMIFA